MIYCKYNIDRFMNRAGLTILCISNFNQYNITDSCKFISIVNWSILTDKGNGGNIASKENLHRKLGIFIFPIVSVWTNVFIVTWLSYAVKELTNSLAFASDWLTKR